MTEKTNSVAIKQAIEEIEKMIEDYKKPRPVGLEEKDWLEHATPYEKEKEENFRLSSDFTGRMIAQGMERALEVIKKRVKP